MACSISSLSLKDSSFAGSFLETQPKANRATKTSAANLFFVYSIDGKRSRLKVSVSVVGIHFVRCLVLAPKAGHVLWQLVVMPKNGNTNAKASLAEKILQKQFVLTGTCQGKDFVYSFDKEERLEPLHFQ